MTKFKTIAAVVIGNALEWYDFVIYSFMTVYIAKCFFPAVNEINSLLAATATFGVAFFMRPVGGIILGFYADKKGRKQAITLIISLMTVALLLIAAAPTYYQAGIAAPLIILFARLLQGFSAGGQFGASTAILTELAPHNARGFYCSWQSVGQSCAMLMGTGVGILLTHFLTLKQLQTWGWRIPFVVGLIIIPIGIYIRNNLDESRLQVKEAKQFKMQMKSHIKPILIASGLVAGATAATYINLIHMSTYAHEYLQFSMADAFAAVMSGSVVIVFAIPFFGWLSDRIGRKPVLLAAIVLYLVLIFPLFHWLYQSPSFMHLVLVQFIICNLLGAYFGAHVATVAELFPAEIRSTSLSISYNSAVILFGGFAQFIVTGLIHMMGSPLAVIYYLVAAFTISLIAAICYQEKAQQHEHIELALAADSV